MKYIYPIKNYYCPGKKLFPKILNSLLRFTCNLINIFYLVKGFKKGEFIIRP